MQREEIALQSHQNILQKWKKRRKIFPFLFALFVLFACLDYFIQGQNFTHLSYLLHFSFFSLSLIFLLVHFFIQKRKLHEIEAEEVFLQLACFLLDVSFVYASGTLFFVFLSKRIAEKYLPILAVIQIFLLLLHLSFHGLAFYVFRRFREAKKKAESM